MSDLAGFLYFVGVLVLIILVVVRWLDLRHRGGVDCQYEPEPDSTPPPAPRDPWEAFDADSRRHHPSNKDCKDHPEGC